MLMTRGTTWQSFRPKTSHGLVVKKSMHVAPPCQEGIVYLQSQAKNGAFSCWTWWCYTLWRLEAGAYEPGVAPRGGSATSRNGHCEWFRTCQEEVEALSTPALNPCGTHRGPRRLLIGSATPLHSFATPLAPTGAQSRRPTSAARGPHAHL
jgi:hypothetical protein